MISNRQAYMLGFFRIGGRLVPDWDRIMRNLARSK